MKVVLLLSRGLARLLDDDGTIIRQTLKRVANNNASEKGPPNRKASVDVLTAVVDMVPGRRSQEENKEKQASQESTKFEDLEQDGFEGMAYHATFDNIFQMPDGCQSRPEKSLAIPDIALTGAETLPLLRLCFHDSKGPLQTIENAHTVLSIPLASTLFQTGHPSMIKYSRWKIGNERIVKEYEVDPSTKEHSIYLPCREIVGLDHTTPSTKQPRRDHQTSPARLNLPLHFLAWPRRIKNSMGNVITKLQSPNEVDEVPASQELEKCVSHFFEHEQIDPQQMAVWALIIPQEIVSSRKPPFAEAQAASIQTTNSQEDKATIAADLIFQGAKLRRVLSGGGGWGQKMGLLSVDPDDSYSIDQSNSSNLAEYLGAGDQNQDPNIRQVASPGDYIAFFAAIDAKSTPGRDMNSRSDDCHVHLSVLPSTIDSMHDSATGSKDASGSEKHTEIFENHFGALSEGGMSLERPKQGYETKLDVPNAKFKVKLDRLVDGRDALEEKGTLDPKPSG